MKRILKKAGILLLVFLLGTAGTALLLNSESTDNRSDFNDAVFPEVMVDMNDTLINRIYRRSRLRTALLQGHHREI